MKEYKNLTATSVDKKQLTEYVELQEEIITLQARLDYLRRVSSSHSELNSELWRTATGKICIIADMDDEHLINIVGHCARNGDRPPQRIEDEIYKRGLTENAQKALAAGQDKYEERFDLADIPF